MSSRNNFNIELIRFFAVLAVILVHMSMGDFYSLLKSGNVVSWAVDSFYFSLTRFCVPVFFIISAHLVFTSKSEKKWYERIIKLIIPFVAWSIIYYLFNGGRDIAEMFKMMLTATTSFHLWFIPAFIGYSILLPTIKAAFTEENKEKFKHVPILIFIFTILTPTIAILLRQFTGDDFSYVYGFQQFYLALPAYLTYAFCYPYLHKKIKPTKGMIIFSSLTIFNWILVSYLSIRNDSANEDLYGFTTAIVFIASFYFFNSIMSMDFSFVNNKIRSFIMSVGKYSFGIYLCHWFVFDFLTRHGFYFTSKEVYSPIANTVLVFIFSYLLILTIKKIKYINKIA